jgi:hypothetical protein
MRTGITLAKLREELQIEAGLSTQNGGSAQTIPRLNSLLNRTERLMGRMEEFTAESTEEEVTVAADAQYADLPETIDFTEIVTADVLHGNWWQPITHGITARERSIYDTTARATPISRWKVVPPGNEEFEVWPIGSVAQTIRFSGQRKIGGMVKDTDTCVLDADVIVLRAAAELLARDRKEDAQLKLRMAQELTTMIAKKQGANKGDTINLADRGGTPLRPGIDFIPPGSA